jgi:hypothetical protein
MSTQLAHIFQDQKKARSLYEPGFIRSCVSNLTFFFVLNPIFYLQAVVIH